MKPATTITKSSERNLGPQSIQSPSASRNTPSSSHKNQTANNRKFESKTRSNGSPRKYDRSRDSKKDPFVLTNVEKRFVIDDEDLNNDYEYENAYESNPNDTGKRSNQNNTTQPPKNSKNSRNINSPRSQLSPRKKKIQQKISKLEAELKELQSSVISGMKNDNTQSYSEVAQQINAKKKKINELEKLAELEKREAREENISQELRRRIEILEKNQEEILSPKPKPNLGFMSPHDAIISIKAQPEDGSSLIERRNQEPLNVDVPNNKSNNKSSKKSDDQQIQEREISLSSEKKLNESSFCKLNPIEAKNFADKHVQDIISSDAKKHSRSNAKTTNLSSHHESDKQNSNYKSNGSTKKHNESPRHQTSTELQKDHKSHHKDRAQEKKEENRSNDRSNRTSKNHNEPPKNLEKSKRPKTLTRSIDINPDEYDQDIYKDLSVDVTIVEVMKIPDASTYCVIFTKANKDLASKTKVTNSENNSNVLNESFHFSFNQSTPKSGVLVVIVKKEDLLKGDKIIGSVKIDLYAVIRSMNKKRVNKLDKIFPILIDSKIKTEGRLHLIFTKGNERNDIKQENDKEYEEKDNENNVEKQEKTPSISDNQPKEQFERDVELNNLSNSEPQNVQPTQQSDNSESKSSESKHSKGYSRVAPKPKEENSLHSSSGSSQKQNSSNTNNMKSPKSPKYNWNNGSLLNRSNRKKPVYELLSEDEDEEQKESDKDTFDENAPALNPSSFPVPKIKYSPSVTAGINRENETKDQLTLSLQEILKQTGTPVQEREVDFSFENQNLLQEEEEENLNKENDEDDLLLLEDGNLTIEQVSETEDQINNKLDKKFGKEAPRLSSAEASELDYNFNKSEDAVTFNLSNVAKYYQPRFLDTVPQQRRKERKQKQMFNDSRKPTKRSANVFDIIEEEEENNEDIEAKFEANLNSLKKKPRITKVSDNEDDLVENEDEQYAILPINEDDEDIEKEIENHSKNSEISIEIDQKSEDDNSNNDINKDRLSQSSSDDDDDMINKATKRPLKTSGDDDDNDIDLNDNNTESLGQLEFESFDGENENRSSRNSSPKKVYDKLDSIEKVESSNRSTQRNSLKEPKSDSNAQKLISIKPNSSSLSSSGIPLIDASSSFFDNSLKSSLDQIKFTESVQQISNQNRKSDDNDDFEEEEEEDSN